MSYWGPVRGFTIGPIGSRPAADPLKVNRFYINELTGEIWRDIGTDWQATGGSAAAGALLVANNLSDLDDAATARINLVLNNVNNTADSAKPVSTAQAAADAVVLAAALAADPTLLTDLAAIPLATFNSTVASNFNVADFAPVAALPTVGISGRYRFLTADQLPDYKGGVLYYDNGLIWLALSDASGTTASKPTADAANLGMKYWDIDLTQLERSNGATWDVLAGGTAASILDHADVPMPLATFNADFASNFKVADFEPVAALPASGILGRHRFRTTDKTYWFDDGTAVTGWIQLNAGGASSLPALDPFTVAQVNERLTAGEMLSTLPGEIAALTEKVTPASADKILINDSADSDEVKYVEVGNLPGGGGSGTVTSVAISGTDGIEVDSGSPVTTAGTIQLGSAKLAAIEALADVTDAANVAAAGASIISSGAGAPSSTPAAVGNVYVDTTNDVGYVATGTASSADWTVSTGVGISVGAVDPTGGSDGDFYYNNVKRGVWYKDSGTWEEVGIVADGATLEVDATNGLQIKALGVDTAQLADDAVTLAKMAPGTDGNLITYDASGNPAYVATGTATHLLTSNGPGTAPTFQVGGGGASTYIHSSHFQTTLTALDNWYTYPLTSWSADVTGGGYMSGLVNRSIGTTVSTGLDNQWYPPMPMQAGTLVSWGIVGLSLDGGTFHSASIELWKSRRAHGQTAVTNTQIGSPMTFQHTNPGVFSANLVESLTEPITNLDGIGIVARRVGTSTITSIRATLMFEIALT